MKVVANTTPLISLASINRLDILEKLFGKIIIAEAVYYEIKAKEIKANFVIIDENLGYKIANSSGLTAIRTLSLLLKAKEKNHISRVKPLLDEMIEKGRWYSNSVYRAFLIQAREL